MHTPDWARANCRDWPDPEEFFQDIIPPHIAEQCCGPCPIRVECFEWADQRGELGFWGGTTDTQREAMATGTKRAKCPICQAPAPFRIADQQICGFCGMSWPVKPEKTAAPHASAA